MARHARRLIVWTAGVLLALALLATVGIALFIWGIDPDVFRQRIERVASDALGRRVELNGALRWRPGLNFQLESRGGRISNADGFGSSPLASWEALRLGVELRPLLDHRVVVDRIEADGLQVNLIRSARGVNWNLPPASSTQQEPGMKVAIGSIGLRNAAIRFSDPPQGRAWSVSQMTLEVQLPPDMDAATLQFRGLSLQARLDGAPFAPAGIALQVMVPELNVEPALKQLQLPQWQVKWGDAAVSGALELRASDGLAASGNVRIAAPSLRRLLQSVSVESPATRDVTVLGPLALATNLSLRDGTAALTHLDMTLDSTRVQGDVSLPALSPLALRFALTADQVDVDRYLTPEDQPGTPLTLPLAQLKALDAKGVLTIRRATLAGAAARELRVDVD